jgi:hypothetical protein
MSFDLRTSKAVIINLVILLIQYRFTIFVAI